MRYQFTEEQKAVREVARSFAERHFSDEDVRGQLDTSTGFDEKTWSALGSELGILGLALPSSHGGEQEGVVALAVVAEELGRVLAGVPLLGSVALAGTVLAQSQDQVARDLAHRVIAGTHVVSLVATDERGRWAPGGTDVAAEHAPGGPRLTGAASHVLDSGAAETFLVVARGESGPGLYLVGADADGVTVKEQSVLDQTRRLGKLVLERAPARSLTTEKGLLEVVARARDVGAVVLAAEAAGAVDRLRTMSVAYASTRLQFGRPIGSFQAVKHRCADMHVLAEQARSTAYHAAWVLDDSCLDDARVAVDVATACTAAAYQSVVKDTVQVHGGIGFTWEHPAHLYYKRAMSDATLLGGRASAVDRLAAVLEQADGPQKGASVQ